MVSGQTPRVSVCIPTVNRPRLLAEAIGSVADQTFRDFEVLIADNSGKAEYGDAIREVVAQFPALTFRVITHCPAVHVAANFNSMIEAARGELWTCLPDDDRFCPTFLARSVATLDEHSQCGFTFADHWIIRADGTIDEPASLHNSAVFARTSLPEGIYEHDRLFEVVLKQAPCFQTAVFRRTVIASFKFLANLLVLDLSLFLRLSSGATPVPGYYLADRLMEYRIHPDQISSTTRRIEFLGSQIAALESVDRVPPRYQRQFNAKLGRQYLSLALLEAEQGAHASARDHALRSLRLSPRLGTALAAALAVVAPGAIRNVRQLKARLHA
jgi:glycosyltransferase involved in cell wall biosynthesis